MKLFARKQKEQYYSTTEIDRTKATYRVIFGQRSNGKTYSTIKKVIEEYLKTGIPSAYIRRYSEEIRRKFIEELLTPHIDTIKKLSKGKYNTVEYVSNAFYLAYHDPENPRNRYHDEKPLLYTVALNTWNTTKGQDRGFLKYIIFDEFMTRQMYLFNEFPTFANCLSSLIRDRDGTIVYMLANSVNKYAPYIKEMGLHHMLAQEQGTIELYTYNNKKLTVAVEYCAQSENTKDIEYYYAFDNPSLDMITTGAWETDNYRHINLLEWDLTELTERVRIYVEFGQNKVVGEIHTHGAEWVIFFHDMGSSNKTLTERDIVYTDKPITSMYHSNDLFNGLTGVHKCVAMLMRTNHDYYSNNTIGEIINNFKKYSNQVRG